MPSTDFAERSAPARRDFGFAKLLVVVNGAVPLCLLGWDAYRHRLGTNAVNSAIHVSGWLGLLFLALSLAITPLRKLTSWSRLILLRRTLGLYAFLYLLVHFAIFFWFDRAASVGDTLHEILTRRYLQLGTAGLVLLCPLALTSTDAMVARLGAKRWKALHRLAYGAAGLGAIHYCLLVKADLRQPLVFAAVLGVLLGFRLVGAIGAKRRHAPRQRATDAGTKGANRFWSGKLVVQQIVAETPDVKTFRLGVKEGGPLPFSHRPGQYLSLTLTIDGKRVHRSYTIASSPTERSYCELTIKRDPNGRASRFLHDVLRAGTPLEVTAPAGRFVFTGEEADSVLLIAGGVGVTPLMAIIRYLTDRAYNGQIHLLFSVRRREDVIFADELQRLQLRFPNLRVCLALSGSDERAWAGERGRISAAMIRRFVPSVTELPIYLCGPAPMMTATREILAALGVPGARIHTEAFVSTAGRDVGATAVRTETEVPSTAGSFDGERVRVATVTFRRSMTQIELSSEQSILEAAEAAGLALPFECRSGICGQCKTRLLAGRVTMEVDEALSDADRSSGLILACQARPLSDLTVDA